MNRKGLMYELNKKGLESTGTVDELRARLFLALGVTVDTEGKDKDDEADDDADKAQGSTGYGPSN